MTQSRRYLFTLVEGGGTVPPELSVVRKLVARGHEVTVLGDDTMEQEALATGAAFRPWITAPNRRSRRAEDELFRDWDCKSPGKLIARLLDTALATPAPRYAADVEAAIADVRPDAIVVSQFGVGATVAAEAAGIPFAIIMPNVYLLPADGLPPFGLGLRPAQGTLGRARDLLISRMTARYWDKGLDRINTLRAERGLAPLAHFWQQFDGADRQLVLTSESFDFPARFPANVRYVGPELCDPDWVQTWEPPIGDEPLVLVAMSSTFQDQIDNLQRVVDAMGTLAVRAVVTTGPAVDPASLRGAANVTVVRSAPHNEVLKHAAAVITHGGHGTVVKTLAAGVPMIVMPHGRDQADNATRVAVRGAGITVRKAAKPEKIAAAVRTILDDASYRESAARLGAVIRTDAASDDVVTELEAIAPTRSETLSPTTCA